MDILQDVTFQLVDHFKTRRSGPPRSVFIKRLEADKSVCPVAFLESYEKATLSKRWGGTPYSSVPVSQKPTQASFFQYSGR